MLLLDLLLSTCVNYIPHSEKNACGTAHEHFVWIILYFQILWSFYFQNVDFFPENLETLFEPWLVSSKWSRKRISYFFHHTHHTYTIRLKYTKQRVFKIQGIVQEKISRPKQTKLSKNLRLVNYQWMVGLSDPWNFQWVGIFIKKCQDIFFIFNAVSAKWTFPVFFFFFPPFKPLFSTPMLSISLWKLQVRANISEAPLQ